MSADHGTSCAVGSALSGLLMRKSAKSGGGDPDRAEALADFASRTAAGSAPGVLSAAYAAPTVLRHTKALGGILPSMAVDDVPDAAAGTPEHAVESLRVKGTPLREFLRRRGIALRNSVGFKGFGTGPAFVAGDAVGRAVLEQLGVQDGQRGAILLGFNPKAPASAVQGIAAHELGHALRSRYGLARTGMYQGSKALTMLLGTLASLPLSKRDASGRDAALWSAATAMASAPMLHEEIEASRWGSRLAGLKGLRRLGAFRGVPTYIATAATPGIVFGVRRLIDHIRGGRKS